RVLTPPRRSSLPRNPRPRAALLRGADVSRLELRAHNFGWRSRGSRVRERVAAPVDAERLPMIAIRIRREQALERNRHRHLAREQRQRALQPSAVFVHACVATAPARPAHGTTLPTAGRAVAIASPKSPVRAQRPTIENVWNS